MVEIMTKEEMDRYWERELEDRKHKCFEMEMAVREASIKEVGQQLEIVAKAAPSLTPDQLNLAALSIQELQRLTNQFLVLIEAAPYSHDAWDRLARMVWAGGVG